MQPTEMAENLDANSNDTAKNPSSKATIIGGVLAGIGASTCCLGPFLLVSAGVTGSWIGNLSAMEAYRPYLMIVALIFIALAFRKLYLTPQSCDVDTPCAAPSYIKKQRIIFWIATVFILVVISFPYYGPYLLD